MEDEDEDFIDDDDGDGDDDTDDDEEEEEEENNYDHLETGKFPMIIFVELLVGLLNMTSWRWNTEEDDPIPAGNQWPSGTRGWGCWSTTRRTKRMMRMKRAMRMRMMRMRNEDEDEDEEDEDDEDEDEDENEDDDDPLSYQLEISSRGGLGGTRGDRTWACRKVSGFPLVLLPAYSLLKQEQLQLAQPAFVAFPKMFKGQRFS